MRMILTVTIPHAKFNEKVKDGTAGPTLEAILEETKPEAVYFTEHEGQRCAILVVDLAEPSQVPRLAEPWFLSFEANCEFRIVMSPEDLAKAGLAEIGQKYA